MKRCNRCILPESIPGITFNEEDICNYCTDYHPIEYLGEIKLVEQINSTRSKAVKYDCIVPLSGGRDSSYVLYLAKKKYGLNILAVNYDNEFRNDQALVNMQRACEILDVDFISLRSKRDVAKKIVRKSVKNALCQGLKALAVSFCDACAYGYHAVVYMLAEKHNVPLIIWGSSKIENIDNFTDNYFQDKKTLVQKIINQLKVVDLKYYRLLQRLEFPVPKNTVRVLRLAKPRLMNPDIKEISLFDYIPWNREKIKEVIISELGWEKAPNSISTWRTDCKLEEFVEYCFMNIFGCSKKCLGYHNMINENQMTREEALEQESMMNPNFSNELERLLVEIGLSENDIRTIRSFQKM